MDRKYASDTDTHIYEHLRRGKESVTLGRRRTSPLNTSISDKVVGIHGTVLRLVPKFGPNSSVRRRTIFELIRSSTAAPSRGLV
jgi:hypothetical protein